MDFDQAWRQFDELDDDDPRRWQIAQHFCYAIGTGHLQGHQVVEKRADDELEMRGTYHTYPVRMKLDMTWGSVEWEIKAHNPAGRTMYLHWDTDAIPSVGSFTGQHADAWDEDHDDVKVFFGRGLYVEAGRAEVEAVSAVFQALPPQTRQMLVQFMPTDRIPRIYCYAGDSILLGYSDELHEMNDVVNTIARGAWIVGQLAWGLSQIDRSRIPQPDTAPQSGFTQRVQCRYCSTIYLWGLQQLCPNCGAAYQG